MPQNLKVRDKKTDRGVLTCLASRLTPFESSQAVLDSEPRKQLLRIFNAGRIKQCRAQTEFWIFRPIVRLELTETFYIAIAMAAPSHYILGRKMRKERCKAVQVGRTFLTQFPTSLRNTCQQSSVAQQRLSI